MGLQVNDVIQARLSLSGPVVGGTLKYYNVMLHYSAVTPGVVSLDGFLAAFNAGVGAAAVAALSAQTNVVGTYVRKLNAPSIAERFLAIGDVGAVAGDCCSSIVAGVINKYTGLRGKQYRGFSHFALVAESATLGDQLTDAAIAGVWGDLADAMFAQVVDATSGIHCNAVVLQKTQSNLLTGTPIYATDITECEVNPILGTMKKRKEKIVD